MTALPASAAVNCAVTGVSPNQVMTVTLSAADTVTLAVNGANIDVTPGFLACGTTAGVSSIVVNASLLTDVVDQTVTINGAGFTASIAVNTGAGNDTVSAANTGGDAITVDLGDGTDTFNAATANGAVSVTGGAGNDSVTGGAGGDTLNAGDGANTVNGGAGNDTVTTGSGVDDVAGGDGN
ncbi:MAG: calcium-binding protein, partial [Actinomycetota bacterium]